MYQLFKKKQNPHKKKKIYRSLLCESTHNPEKEMTFVFPTSLLCNTLLSSAALLNHFCHLFSFFRCFNSYPHTLSFIYSKIPFFDSMAVQYTMSSSQSVLNYVSITNKFNISGNNKGLFTHHNKSTTGQSNSLEQISSIFGTIRCTK